MSSIFTRRSIRKYKEKRVEDEKVERLLRAAMQAPSAGNQQEWEFIVVRKKEILKKLSGVSPYAKMTAHADLAVVVLGNRTHMKYPENWEQDLGAATENLLLQAAEEDLGAVWLGVAPLEDRMAHIKEIFHLPEEIEAFALVPVGYPEGENKFVDRWNESKVHYEEYKKK